MIVTGLKYTKRGRVNIFIDGQYSITVFPTVIAKYKIFQEKEIDEKIFDQILKSEQFSKGYLGSVNLILSRPRSRLEIEQYLRLKKKVENEIIERVIKKLEKENYLNDEKFVQLWIESRLKNKPRGRKMIRNELLKKGISKDIIEKFIKSIPESKEINIAQELIKKKYGKMNKNNREKIYRFLISKGFEYKTIQYIISKTTKNISY